MRFSELKDGDLFTIEGNTRLYKKLNSYPGRNAIGVLSDGIENVDYTEIIHPGTVVTRYEPPKPIPSVSIILIGSREFLSVGNSTVIIPIEDIAYINLQEPMKGYITVIGLEEDIEFQEEALEALKQFLINNMQEN